MFPSKPFVTLTDVTVRADDRTLFKNLGWTISEGEQWAVIGPNASGKSALMEVLAGQKPPAGGEVQHHFLKESGSLQEAIAYVAFEEQRSALGNGAFYQDRWNVGLSEAAPSISDVLSERGIKRVNPFIVDIPILNSKVKYRDFEFRKRQRTVIKEFGLKPLLSRKLFELSNGERRKVAIARALLKDPRLLILDNPFGGLDKRFRVTLKKILEKLIHGPMRVIIIGTDRDEIPRGITHVLHIDRRGRVVKETLKKSTKSAIGRIQKTQPKPKTKSRGEILVQMKRVNVSYSGRPILKNLNWTVREPEKWALFGPNGAGKTTLLSLILGDNPQAYANDIRLFGRRRGTGESIWEIKKKIGWVSPELQLYYPLTGSTSSPQASSGQAPHDATCLDVVCSGWFDSIGLYRQCSAHQKKIARAWLKKFEMDERANVPFVRVSGGEQRLALLARALVKNPKLLVLDEPCQGLDAHNCDRVLAAIDSVCKSHDVAMIYVTHRLDELPRSITHTLTLGKQD